MLGKKVSNRLLTCFLKLHCLTNEENFDGSSLRPGRSTSGGDYVDRNKSFGKADVQLLCK